LVDYENTDAVGLAALVRSGEVTAVELVNAAISRIEAHDGAINAVVRRRFEQARAEAAGDLPDGPLKGVPYLLKDLHVAVAGESTGGGTALLQDLPLDYDR